MVLYEVFIDLINSRRIVYFCKKFIEGISIDAFFSVSFTLGGSRNGL